MKLHAINEKLTNFLSQSAQVHNRNKRSKYQLQVTIYDGQQTLDQDLP